MVENGLKRVAVIFNGSLPKEDLVAVLDRSFVRALQPFLLDEHHFDTVYRLDDECQTKDVRQDVICLPPTLDSLKAVVQGIKDSNTTVFTFVNGHGAPNGYLVGGIAGRDFADVLNMLPSAVSRITILHQCFGGAFRAFNLVDDNDLLWAYTSAGEFNITDASGLAILQKGIDPNGDGVHSLQEIFWRGQSYIYNKFSPFYRRFVFQRGLRFADRGLETKAVTPPFPNGVVEASDVSTYLKLTGQGSSQGVTVIGFEGQSETEVLRKHMEEAAQHYQGFTQFIWVPQAVAVQVVTDPERSMLKKESAYKIFYVGGDESRMFTTTENIVETLEKIYSGEKLQEKKK